MAKALNDLIEVVRKEAYGTSDPSRHALQEALQAFVLSRR